jgi:hypothetical protein
VYDVKSIRFHVLLGLSDIAFVELVRVSNWTQFFICADARLHALAIYPVGSVIAHSLGDPNSVFPLQVSPSTPYRPSPSRSRC